MPDRCNTKGSNKFFNGAAVIFEFDIKWFLHGVSGPVTAYTDGIFLVQDNFYIIWIEIYTQPLVHKIIYCLGDRFHDRWFYNYCLASAVRILVPIYKRLVSYAFNREEGCNVSICKLHRGRFMFCTLIVPF